MSGDRELDMFLWVSEKYLWFEMWPGHLRQ